MDLLLLIILFSVSIAEACIKMIANCEMFQKTKIDKTKICYKQIFKINNSLIAPPYYSILNFILNYSITLHMLNAATRYITANKSKQTILNFLQSIVSLENLNFASQTEKKMPRMAFSVVLSQDGESRRFSSLYENINCKIIDFLMALESVKN